MEILSAGAAKTVTGSCHHITIEGQQVVIDAGLFQGGRTLEALNSEPFPFTAGAVDAVVLTHGHLDHVGRLPSLVKAGYSGPIYATRATIEIAGAILRDSVRLQLEDYRRDLRRAKRSGREDQLAPPIYDEGDVEKTLERLKVVEFDQRISLGRGVTATLQPSGHILGSGWLQLESPNARLVASGDLGNRESALQSHATPPPACDVVMVESTYGNRNHRSRGRTAAQFETVIREAIEGGGNVLIPSFALERTQQILYQFSMLEDSGALGGAAIYLDSPMATKMTELYRTRANEFRPDVASELDAGRDPFTPDALTYTVATEASKALNEIDGGSVFIAGSGMMTGGRILHHLKHNLWRPEACLIVVGYQAQGTLGRRLIDGADSVRIFGEDIVVRASIHTVGGFSAHADRDDLLAWLEPTEDATIVLVHGEEDVMHDFAGTLERSDRTVELASFAVPMTF